MKKYCSIKILLNAIEILGGIVLLLVIIAIMGMKTSWMSYSTAVSIGFLVLFSSIIVSFCSSFARLTGLWSNERFLVVWGIVLLIFGGYALMALPEFFHTMKDIPYSYWHRVSLYSMPAICIEGGLFTLFRAYTTYAQSYRTMREQYLLFIGFVLYAVVAVAVNFLAIDGIISVETQLLFSRVIVVMALSMTIVLYYYRNRESRSSI